MAGEQLESVAGPIRMVCNSDLDPRDVETARAAQAAVRRSWCGFEPEKLLDGAGDGAIRDRYRRLFELLRSGKLQVRVLPDEAFGLVHGKAGVITLADGARTCFLGSANESKSAWQMNYELVWEDTDPQVVQWVQDEFDALWSFSYAIGLADFVVQDLDRLAQRRVLHRVADWTVADETPDPAPATNASVVVRANLQAGRIKSVGLADTDPRGRLCYGLFVDFSKKRLS